MLFTWFTITHKGLKFFHFVNRLHRGKVLYIPLVDHIICSRKAYELNWNNLDFFYKKALEQITNPNREVSSVFFCYLCSRSDW